MGWKFNLLLAFALLLCGCESITEPPTGTSFTERLITGYCIPDRIDVSHENANSYIRISLRGRWVSKTEASLEYDALSTKYNDLSYNAYVFGAPKAMGVEYAAINVTCDKAFDGDHAAGESLGDVFTLNSYSYKKFIDNGYVYPGTSDREHHVFDSQRGAGVYKPLDKVEPEDLILIEPDIYLYLTTKPAAGEYEFTVEVVSRDRDGLTGKIKMTF